MKLIRKLALLLAASLLLASCSSLANGAVSGAIGAIAGGKVSAAASGGSTAAAAPAVADFQPGELLCSTDNGKMEDAAYYTAKVITPASDATKNQAEVVFVENGKKSWVNYVVNSRKATKADFSVGAMVFVLSGWQDHDEISAESYRKGRWHLANITSTEELFKKRVEAGGESFAIDYVRVPTDPIK